VYCVLYLNNCISVYFIIYEDGYPPSFVKIYSIAARTETEKLMDE
jgi:hypothetical protein